MAFVDDLTVLLDTSTKIAVGSSLFKNAMPESTARAVFVHETPGLPAVEKFGGELPAMTRPRAQVTICSTKAVGGSGIAASTATRILAQDMWELVVGVHNETVNGVVYQRMEPLQDVFFLRRDEAGRGVFCFNVQALRSATTQA